MEISWYSNANIILLSGKTKLVFDPFLGMPGCENKPTAEDFTDATDICITHGHFDHIYSLPQILKDFKGKLHCGQVCLDNLKGMDCVYKNVHKIYVDRTFSIGDMKVTPLKAAHVVFDKKLMAKTIARIMKPGNIKRGIKMLKLNKALPEGDETIAYHVQGEKSILLFGSLATDSHTMYPYGVDLLILPYQGHSNVLDIAMDKVSMIKPKAVMLSHFDDAFPPVSTHIDTEPFVRRMAKEYPDIRVIIPKFKERIEI